MITVTWGPMGTELDFSFEILNDSYAAGCASLCIGGLIFIPLALKFGRRPIYIVSLVLETGVAIWSARLQNVADLMLVNVFSCLIGALCEIMVQMTVADIYFVHQRGLMNSIYVWVLTFGSALAPLAAGFITVDEGWRWVWWWNAIFMGVTLLVFVFLYEETKYDRSTICGQTPDGQTNAAEVIDVDEKAAEMRRNSSKNPEASTIVDREEPVSKATINPAIPMKSYRARLTLWSPSPVPLRHYLRHVYQPFLILINIPAVSYMALLNGGMIASALMPITIYSTYMTLPPYNFTASQIGLLGLPSFIGTLLGAIVTGPTSDWMILRLAKRNGGIYEPEMRLWLILAFTPFLAAGLLMFGIGVNNGLSWPFIAVGLGLSSFGSTPATSLSLTYLTDAYTDVSLTASI